MKDNRGRDWTGDFERQRFIERRVIREAKLHRESAIDVVAALGSIIATLIAGQARDLEHALEGLEAHRGDLERAMRDGFADRERKGGVN